MRLLKQMTLSVALVVLSGCTTIQRIAHMYSSEAPSPLSFKYGDGGSSIYYSFTIGNEPQPKTVIFYAGGSGCWSRKSVMPGYLSGLTVSARVFVLNKRFMPDRSIGIFDCGKAFHLANNPSQWISDYSEFIAAQLGSLSPKPKHVVMVGVSEGGLVATKVAVLTPAITHLAIIGYGGYSVRRMYEILEQKGQLLVDVDELWQEVPSDPRNVNREWNGSAYRWWADMMDIDPLPDYLKLDIPIIIGVGEKDQSMPVESVLFLDAKFKEAGKNNLTLKVYPDSDHVLRGQDVSHRGDFFAALSRLLQPSTHNIALKRKNTVAPVP